MSTPKCFISYSWDDEKHKDWVRALAVELRKNGVETILDQWDCDYGIDLTQFMESSIRESDFVLLICTPNFCRKANLGKGGTGYEKCIVTGEIFTGIASPKKFVPILRKGEKEESLPSYLKTKNYLDFRDDINFSSNLEKLLRHIHNSPKYVKPPLGKMPTFSQKNKETEQKPKKTKKTDDFSFFKEIYTFAYSSQGLDLTKKEALEFTAYWTENHPEKSYSKLEEIYTFAYSSQGLDLTKKEALDFTTDWVENHFDRDFSKFQKIYTFAHSTEGLDLTKNEALDFTTDWVENHFDRDFSKFQEIFTFANSTFGLDLTKNEALKFTLNKFRKKSEQV